MWWNNTLRCSPCAVDVSALWASSLAASKLCRDVHLVMKYCHCPPRPYYRRGRLADEFHILKAIDSMGSEYKTGLMVADYMAH